MRARDSGADDTSSAPESPAEPGPTKRRHRRLFLVAGLCGATIVLGIVWIAVTGLVARSKLEAARAALPELRHALFTGDLGRAQRLSADIRADADSAHALVSGPAWWVGANLPLGTPLRTTRTIAGAVDDLAASGLPAVIELSRTLHSATLHHGHSIAIPPLASAQRVVTQADAATATALSRVSDEQSATWFGPIDRVREAFAKQLSTLRTDLSTADHALRTALPMLGQDGLRRYFIGFENEAESRGLGGLPGAFAVVTVDHGKVRFTAFGNDDSLKGVRADVDLGSDYQARYGSADPTGVFQNSDIGPDFRDAARIWAAMWEKKSGQRVDGAIALDPTALGYLLRETGPAPLSPGGEVSADNVVALTQQTQYSTFTDAGKRKNFVVDVARAISTHIMTGRGSPSELVKAFAHAARDRRLVVWSADRAEEAWLVESRFAGALPSGAGPVTGFTVTNAAGSKLDYYLDRTMTYTRSGCAGGSPSTAILTLTNNAPRSGLPPYVTIRADKPAYRTRPGDNRVIVTYYGTPGAHVTSATLDGKMTPVAIGREHGLLTVSIAIELPVQHTRRFSLTLGEPPTHGSLQTIVQPGVREETVHTAMPARCS